MGNQRELLRDYAWFAFTKFCLHLLRYHLQEFAKMVDKCVQNLQQNFKDSLEDKCRVGAANVGF